MSTNMKIIFSTRAGSHLYGTSTPLSDIDIRGVCIVPLREMVDPFQNFEQYMGTPDEDLTIFNLPKFFNLASAGNPNIVELLFSNQESILELTPEGSMLLDGAELFLSQRVRKTFVGYSYSQLKRIKTHRDWLLNPPNGKPTRQEFGLDESPPFGYEKIVNLIHAPEGTISPEWVEYARAEMSYRSAKERWDKYSHWMKNRNPKRAALEEKFGFDLKHANHLVRLLSEGLELLTSGKITFPRPDKDLLISILSGEFTYDEVMDLASDFEDKLTNVYSSLPKNPNLNNLRNLYYEILGV